MNALGLTGTTLPTIPDDVLRRSFNFQAAARRPVEVSQPKRVCVVGEGRLTQSKLLAVIDRLTEGQQAGVLVREIRPHVDATPNRVSAMLQMLCQQRRIVQMTVEFGYWHTYFPADRYNSQIRPYKTRLACPDQQRALEILMADSPITWRQLVARMNISKERSCVLLQLLSRWGLAINTGHSRTSAWHYSGL